MATKICTKCGVEKQATLEFFYRKKADSLRSFCRSCCNNDSHGGYVKNSKTVIERTLVRRSANKDHYRKLNTASRGLWRKKNKERNSENNRRWRSDNKEHFSAWRKENYKKMRQSPTMRLNDAVRARIRQFVKKNGESKSVYLPFTVDELKTHLERQFSNSMSWNNFGKGKDKWNIDHIVPLRSFKYDSMSHPDFKAAWALTNLRPLWSDENNSKSGKRTHLI